MTIEIQIRDEKLQYDINREAAKISTLSSGKIDKYECLTGEEILPCNQQQIIEQAKSTFEDQGKKQVDALVALKRKEIKPRETNPNEYSDYFLNGLVKIRESFEPVNFYDLTYNFKEINL